MGALTCRWFFVAVAASSVVELLRVAVHATAQHYCNSGDRMVTYQRTGNITSYIMGAIVRENGLFFFRRINKRVRFTRDLSKLVIKAF